MPSAADNQGDPLPQWWAEFRERLRAVVQLRMTPLLAGRVDPSDIVQEAFAEATERLAEYQRQPTLSPYLWLRFLTLQRLNILYRRHVGALKRAATREVVMPDLDVSSVALAERLVDSVASPSESAIQREQYERLHAALEAMPPQDREILTLRHFEHLDHDQAAEALGITLAAARRRYYRALERLRDVISPLLGDGNV